MLVIPGWTGRLAGWVGVAGQEGPGAGESGCVCIGPRAPGVVTELGLWSGLRFSSLSRHEPMCPFPRWPPVGHLAMFPEPPEHSL